MKPTEEIQAWLAGDRDYSAGIALLQRYGNKKILAATLAKPGKERNEQNHRKLAYELSKVAGMPKTDIPAPQPKPVAAPVKEKLVYGPALPPDQEPELYEVRPDGQYPDVIRRIKYEFSELYTRRSILHKNMAAIPAENNTANMNARSGMLEEIKKLSIRMDVLYLHLKAYEDNGAVPAEAELWPKPKATEQLPQEPDKLKLMKKNLQTANTKDRNLLQYQQQQKASSDAPMPDGPKRKKIILRIKEREKQIAEIDEKLLKIYE